MTIWKYELEIIDVQGVMMPDGAEILSVANQDGRLCLWAMVDPSKELQRRCIAVVGTGNPVPSDFPSIRRFIGTAVIEPFVWHVFERI